MAGSGDFHYFSKFPLGRTLPLTLRAHGIESIQSRKFVGCLLFFFLFHPFFIVCLREYLCVYVSQFEFIVLKIDVR